MISMLHQAKIHITVDTTKEYNSKTFMALQYIEKSDITFNQLTDESYLSQAYKAANWLPN